MTAEINRMTVESDLIKDEIIRRTKEATKRANRVLAVVVDDPTAEFIFDRDQKVSIKAESLIVRVHNDNVGGVYVQNGTFSPFAHKIDRSGGPDSFMIQTGDTLLLRVVKKWKDIVAIYETYLNDTK